MKLRIGELAIWFYLSYLLYGPLRDAAQSKDLTELFEGLLSGEDMVVLVTGLIAFFAYALTTYLILFYRHRFGHWLLIVLLLIAMVPGVIAFRYFLQEILQKALFGFGNYTDNYGTLNYFFDNLYYALYFPWVGGIFYFVQYSRFRDKQQQKLQIQNQQTQLSLLRSQINPHFLFNSLNNIYSLVYAGSDKSLEAVGTLSGLLRYSLYEQAERVPLQREWQYLNDFIALERMRHDYEIPLELQAPEELESLRIIPFILIPFVENAFKHGELREPAKPVRISLQTEGDDLAFRISNAITERQKDEVGGIGLENVRQRLQLHYGPAHELITGRDGDRYSITLKIALDQC